MNSRAALAGGKKATESGKEASTQKVLALHAKNQKTLPHPKAQKG